MHSVGEANNLSLIQNKIDHLKEWCATKNSSLLLQSNVEYIMEQINDHNANSNLSLIQDTMNNIIQQIMVHPTIIIIVIVIANNSPSDFPEGSTFPPYSKSKSSVNRDMLVVMKSSKIVDIFEDVFTHDWSVGVPWEPKTGKC